LQENIRLVGWHVGRYFSQQNAANVECSLDRNLKMALG